MNKAIFLDRDGTINVEKYYLHKIEDFEFLPGAIEALKMLQDAGFLLIIITNQSGIARGYYSEEDFLKLNTWMLEELKRHDVIISDVYYCPHLPDASIEKYRKTCECRKPKLGMFEQAIIEHNIDLGHSFAIGDKLRDCAICEMTDCQGFLIGAEEKNDVIEEVKAGKRRNICYATSLSDCAEIIIKIEGGQL